MIDPSTHEIAMAVGSAGAYVVVMDDVITDSIRGAWGRRSDFDDTRPGVFSFDLDNSSGKYTPQSATSSLATKVRVGMGVSHFVDGLKRSGTIRSAEPYFVNDPGQGGSFRVRVTCDDMLGVAGRHNIDSLVTEMVKASDPYLWYRLDDATGSAAAADSSGYQQPALTDRVTAAPVTFGVAGVEGILETQVGWSVTGGGTLGVPRPAIQYASAFSTIPYQSSSSLGYWGCWITAAPDSSTGNPSPVVYVAWNRIAGFQPGFSLGWFTNAGMAVPTLTVLGGSMYTGSELKLGVPHYFVAHITQATVAGTTTWYASAWVDGVAFAGPVSLGSYSGSAATSDQATPSDVLLIGSGTSQFSNFSLTERMPQQQVLHGATTEAALLSAVGNLTPQVGFDALPGDLSAAPIGAGGVQSQSVLDIVNDVIRTEQGYIWSETTGTITAPVQKVTVRARDRAATPDYTFSFNDIQPFSPELAADIQNMVATTTANGPTNSQTVTDPDLTELVGSASDSTDVLLRDNIDLFAWAHDRLNRGAIETVRIVSFTVDALTIGWSDVVAIRPGDRVRIDDLPEELGVDHFDGWVTGGAYSFAYPDWMLFTFYLQPALPATGVYDADVYDSAIYAF